MEPELKGWVVVEVMRGPAPTEDIPYSRDIDVWLETFPPEAKAEALALAEVLKKEGKDIEVQSFYPIRRSLDYQGIARRIIK